MILYSLGVDFKLGIDTVGIQIIHDSLYGQRTDCGEMVLESWGEWDGKEGGGSGKKEGGGEDGGGGCGFGCLCVCVCVYDMCGGGGERAKKRVCEREQRGEREAKKGGSIICRTRLVTLSQI